MAFSSQTRHLVKPPHFAVSAIAGAVIDPDSCPLFLRAYDVEALQNLLRARGIPVTSVLPYTRLQGRAAKRHTWWRDTGGCIPKALLLLCAITQTLDPEKRVPNRLHPSHPDYQPVPPRRMMNGRPLVYSWDRALKRRPLPAPQKVVPVFPFRERDGSRFEPFDEVAGVSRVGAMNAWLPRVVANRLAACGAYFREQGVHGPDDPTGKFSHINRSAGMRRLLEAVRRDQLHDTTGPHAAGVDLQAPLMFRGVELYGHPVTSWAGHEHYFRSAKIYLNTRHTRVPAPEAAPAVPAGDDSIVPTGTTGTTQSPPVEQTKPRRAKLRKNAVTEFNPDELG